MTALPKWQQPLAERASQADQTLRAVLLAPGGSAGALLAAAAADRDLAELCREFADRTTSPLLKRLLINGGRALASEAGFLTELAGDDDSLVTLVADVPIPAERSVAEAQVDAFLVCTCVAERETKCSRCGRCQHCHGYCDCEDPAVVDEPAAADEDQAELPARCDDCETTGRNCSAHPAPAAETPHPIVAALDAAGVEEDRVWDLAERRREAEWQGLHVYRDGARPPLATVLVDGVPYAATGWAAIYGDEPVWWPSSPLSDVTEPSTFRDLVARHVVVDEQPLPLAAVDQQHIGRMAAFGDVAAVLGLPRDTSPPSLFAELRRLVELDAPRGDGSAPLLEQIEKLVDEPASRDAPAGAP